MPKLERPINLRETHQKEKRIKVSFKEKDLKNTSNKKTQPKERHIKVL